jgi:lipoate-protein ligase A
MNSKSIYKIPNGKLLKLSLEYNENDKTISSVKIMGDFFAYPAESIEVLEHELKGVKISKKQLFDKINDTIKKSNFEFIGLTAEGLTEGILRCIK